jgi:hypothetical protein
VGAASIHEGLREGAMGILQDLERGVRASISLNEAVGLLASFEEISDVQAAMWLSEQGIVDTLVPVFISWQRVEYGPKATAIEEEGAIQQARKVLGDGLALIEKRPGALEENPKFGGMDRIGWLRDEFWQFVSAKGVRLTADMFSEISECPSFLHSDFVAAETRNSANVGVNPPQSESSRGSGLLAAYEDQRGGYIEFARATYLLANIEGVPFAYAATWLIEKGAHWKLAVYKRPAGNGKSGKAEPARIDRPNDVYAFGPLAVLTVIEASDDLWYDSAGAIQRSANDELGWARDELWTFAVENGANVRASSFALRSDCPTFMLNEWLPTPSGADSDTANAALEPHKLDAAGWRAYAQQAQSIVVTLQNENAQLRARIANLESRDEAASSAGNSVSEIGLRSVDASIDDGIAGLTTEERNEEIVRRSGSGDTHADIATAFGISRRRVGQILEAAKGKEKMRRWPIV